MAYRLGKAIFISAVIFIMCLPSEAYAQSSTTPELKNIGDMPSDKVESEKKPEWKKVKTEDEKRKENKKQKDSPSPMAPTEPEKQKEAASTP